MVRLSETFIPTLPAEECERRLRRDHSNTPHLWSILDAVKDPEIPVVSIWELGVLQDVTQDDSARVAVTITPTYSGCPAIDAISEEIVSVLRAAGYTHVKVLRQLAPAWSSQWLLPAARDALQGLGIAPPEQGEALKKIACPACASHDVLCISEFGSTACKAFYQCQVCAEPFDYFKRI